MHYKNINNEYGLLQNTVFSIKFLHNNSMLFNGLKLKNCQLTMVDIFMDGFNIYKIALHGQQNYALSSILKHFKWKQ